MCRDLPLVSGKEFACQIPKCSNTVASCRRNRQFSRAWHADDTPPELLVSSGHHLFNLYSTDSQDY